MGSRGRLGFQRLTNVGRQIADLEAIRIQHNFHGCPGIEFVVAPLRRSQRKKKSHTGRFKHAAITMAVDGAGGVVARPLAPDLVRIERQRNDRPRTGYVLLLRRRSTAPAARRNPMQCDVGLFIWSF